jgi:hypothetical protein
MRPDFVWFLLKFIDAWSQENEFFA